MGKKQSDYRKRGKKREEFPSSVEKEDGGFRIAETMENSLKKQLEGTLDENGKKEFREIRAKRRREEEKKRQKKTSSFGGSKKGGKPMFKQRRQYTPEEKEKFDRTKRVVLAARAIVQLGEKPEEDPKYKELREELTEALKAQRSVLRGNLIRKMSQETRDMLERYLGARVMRFEEEVDVIFQIDYRFGLCQKRFQDALRVILTYDSTHHSDLVRKHEIKESVSKLNAIKIAAALEEADEKTALGSFLNRNGVPEFWKRVIHFKRFVERLEKDYPDKTKEKGVNTFLDNKNVVNLVDLIKNELRDLTLLGEFKQILPKEMRLLKPEPKKVDKPVSKEEPTAEKPKPIAEAVMVVDEIERLTPKQRKALKDAGYGAIKKADLGEVVAIKGIGPKAVEVLEKAFYAKKA